ncbi:MAG: ABC transporter ATP-binding protein [Oscillospiraceae bacterium]|nr:ABC transporter ATP-binding protein [Oscillospiraceae bacterium]
MSEELLKIKGLNVRYVVGKEVSEAVNGIDIVINQGETLGLVGETGAGKTTTALSIMNMLPQYVSRVQGEIFYKGKDVLKMKEHELRKLRGKQISMVFQDPMTSLNPVYRVGEQIGEVLTLHEGKMSKGELRKRVGEILELVGIPASRQDEYPHQFSGGMKQRVIIAIAIACRPELLIADEPTTALDVTIQAQVLDMMQDLRNTLNSSILMITHDLGIVASFCDNVAIMYAGEIVEYGTLDEIFDRTEKHHPYTEGLFNAIPNLNVKTDRLNPIQGMTPDPRDLPAGCKFHPRCPHACDACKSGQVPVYRRGTHQIKCLLAEEWGEKECEGEEQV